MFCATDDPDVNARAACAAEETGAFVNRVDSPERCDFIVPSVLRRGPLQIAVSTSGASPALARRIRIELEQIYDERYGTCAYLLGAVRSLLMERVEDPARRRILADHLADDDVIETCLDDETFDVEAVYQMIVSKEGVRSCR